MLNCTKVIQNLNFNMLLNQPNIVFSQHDYSVALPFQCLPPDFLPPRSTLLAES